MNYLVVVAHPDDEVLGAGATIHKLIAEGNNVAVVIMVGKASARANLSETLSAASKSVGRLNSRVAGSGAAILAASFPPISLLHTMAMAT